MSFDYLPSPAFILLTLLASIALGYSTFNRWNIDNKALIVGYITMSVANLGIALQRIVTEYVSHLSSVELLLEKIAIFFGVFGIGSILVGAWYKTEPQRRVILVLLYVILAAIIALATI